MFQQVSDVIVGQQAKQAPPAWCEPGQLEIEYSGGAALTHQQIRFFRQIVMHDVGSVQLSQQFCRIPEIRRACWSCYVHGRAGKVSSCQAIGLNRDKLRYRVHIVHHSQNPRFPLQQTSREPAYPNARGARVPQYVRLAIGCDKPNFAEQVLLEQIIFSHRIVNYSFGALAVLPQITENTTACCSGMIDD